MELDSKSMNTDEAYYFIHVTLFVVIRGSRGRSFTHHEPVV